MKLRTSCAGGHDLEFDLEGELSWSPTITVTCLTPGCPMYGQLTLRSRDQLQAVGPNPLLWTLLLGLAGAVVAGPRGALIGAGVGAAGALAKRAQLQSGNDPGPQVL
jgi:hypothetical protein